MSQHVFIKLNIHAGDPNGNAALGDLRAFFRAYPTIPIALCWITGSFEVFLTSEDRQSHPEIEARVDEIKTRYAGIRSIIVTTIEMSKRKILEAANWTYAEKLSPGDPIYERPAYEWNMDIAGVYRYIGVL